jgi:hypothetical protein
MTGASLSDGWMTDGSASGSASITGASGIGDDTGTTGDVDTTGDSWVDKLDVGPVAVPG